MRESFLYDMQLEFATNKGIQFRLSELAIVSVTKNTRVTLLHGNILREWQWTKREKSLSFYPLEEVDIIVLYPCASFIGTSSLGHYLALPSP